MADELNKKITIDVEVNTGGQKQIDQYKAALDSLRSSVNNLASPFGGLSKTISSLDKDIVKLTGSVSQLSKQNQQLASDSSKTKSGVTDLLSTFSSFTTVANVVKGAITGVGEALSAMEAGITAGLSLLITFLPAIIDGISGLFKAEEAVTSLSKSLKEQQVVTDALNDAQLKGTQNAQDELVHLNLLYSALSNKNIKDGERLNIIHQLQQEYPDYFGKLTDEKTFVDQAAKSYTELSKSIMAAAESRAAEDAIASNMKRHLGNAAEVNKLSKQLTETTKQLNNAKADEAELNKQLQSMPNVGHVGDYIGAAKVDDLTEKKDAITKKIKDLQTDSRILGEQNQKLTEIALANMGKTAARATKTAKTTSGFTVKIAEEETIRLKQQEEERARLIADANNKWLESVYDSYGKETLSENNQYQAQLARFKKALNDKLIDAETYRKLSEQAENTHNANLSAIIKKYTEQDKARTEQAINELNDLKIKGMKDGAEKQKAELTQQQTEQFQQLKKNEDELLDQKRKIQKQLDTPGNSSERVAALQEQLQQITLLLNNNKDKRIEIERQTNAAILKIDENAAKDKMNQAAKDKLDSDKEVIDSAKSPKAKLAAEKQLIVDRYTFEIDQAKGNDKKIKDLEKKRDDELTALKKKSQEDLKNFVIKETQELSAAEFSLVTANIKHQSEAKIAGLEKDKTNELSNSSLTSAQKLAIENKYKKQEAAVKVKAFKDEQKASIAQALINGAIAITKAEAQTGVLGTFVIPGIIAETAIQVAKIASQKPPAYAHGGLHYQSDGRGGVLPGYSRTDNTNAYLRSGEGVVVSEAMQVPWARNLVSAINVGFGGRDFSITNPGRGYAVGGIFTDGGDANRYYNQPVNDQKNLANTIAYQMINNFPPVYVDVKDINNQQNILAQTVNRVNL